jgi:hypothetical protein
MWRATVNIGETQRLERGVRGAHQYFFVKRGSLSSFEQSIRALKPTEHTDRTHLAWLRA